MAELISIRECARRLGVSDTAVRKAIAKKRITVASHNKDNGRPLLDYDQVVRDWRQNTDPAMQRMDDGGSNGKVSASSPILVAGDRPAPAAPTGGAPSYNQSRAIREAYAARLLKIEYEQKTGKLVRIEAVAQIVEREYGRVRARLLAIPSKLADEVALTEDISACRSLIEAAITDALSELVADAATTKNGALKGDDESSD